MKTEIITRQMQIEIMKFFMKTSIPKILNSQI